jgi:5'-nucleotidase
VLTNDDGIDSPGLHAALEAAGDLGEILVVAPKHQQSSTGRGFVRELEARAVKRTLRADGARVRAFAVDASPAVVVQYALTLLAQRPPDLLISGINYGENVGNGLTISGTVGAVLEAASEGVPSLAVSLATEPKYHTSHSREVDFRAAAYFTWVFAKKILARGLPLGVEALNVNVPVDATAITPWKITRASRQSYYRWRVKGKRVLGYAPEIDWDTLEPDSDVYAITVEHVVSVTPITFDLTARVGARAMERWLRK